MMCSYSFHLSRTKKTVGPNEQYENHNQIRGDLMETCSYNASNMAFIASSQDFNQADDDSSDDCAANRVYSPQDDSGKGEQCSTAKRRINGNRFSSEEDTSNSSDSCGDAPG